MNLKRTIMKDGLEFIDAAYMGILHRQADDHGIRNYLKSMAAGMTKAEVLLELCDSEEARRRKSYSRDLLIDQLKEAGISEPVMESALRARIHKLIRKVLVKLNLRTRKSEIERMVDLELKKHKPDTLSEEIKKMATAGGEDESTVLSQLLPNDTYRIYRGLKGGIG